MHNKKYLAFILLFFFTLGITPLYVKGEEETPYFPNLPKEEPHLIIAHGSWMPELKAGEKNTLSIPVENTTNATARRVNVSLNIGSDSPLQINSMALNQFAYSISGYSRCLFSFDFFVPPTAKPGTYPINVNVTYQGESTGGGSASETIYVKVINAKKSPVIKYLGVEMENNRLAAGQSSLVKLRLQNDSDFALKDIECKLEGFSPNSINLDNWPETQYIKTLAPREFKMLEYRLIADPKLETSIQALTLNMSYKDEFNGSYTNQAKVYVPVQGKNDNSDELIPRIIVESYDYPYGVEAGQQFPLTLYFLNTSEKTAVRNIKVSFSSENQVFIPCGSSSSFYIAKIEPGERISRTINLKSKADAEAKNYLLNLEIDYQDSKGNKYNEKETVSIPLNQETSLSLSALEIPSDVTVGSPVNLTIDFYNTGRTLIRNLLIKTEGDFDIQESTLFVGNLEPGKSSYYDVTILPRHEGVAEGKIIFTYEDTEGRSYTVEKPFKINASPPPEEAPAPENMPPAGENKQNQFKKFLLPGGIAAAAVIGGFLIYRRRKKRKKLEEVDIDEEF